MRTAAELEASLTIPALKDLDAVSRRLRRELGALKSTRPGALSSLEARTAWQDRAAALRDGCRDAAAELRDVAADADALFEESLR